MSVEKIGIRGTTADRMMKLGVLRIAGFIAFYLGHRSLDGTR